MSRPSLERVVLGGRFGERPQKVSDRLVAAFGECGGVWLETAHAYAGGNAECSVGAAVASAGGDHLRVITKIGHPDECGAPTLDARSLAQQIDISAHRLGRPIDLLMLHRDDDRLPVDELLEPMVRAVSHGTAHRVGVCNWTLDRAQAAYRVLLGRLWAVSLQFSLVVPSRPVWEGTRSADPTDVQWAASTGVALLGWSPLGRGWVPAPGNAPDEARRAFSTEGNSGVVDACDRLAARHNCSRSAAVLAGTLACGAHIRPIVGAECIDEVTDALDGVALATGPKARDFENLVRARLNCR